MECILCGASNLRVTDKVPVPDLCRLYEGFLDHGMADEFRDLASLDYVTCGECGLRFFIPCVTGSPAFYHALSRRAGSRYYQEDKSEYRFAAKFITGDDTVLDIGSGRGLFSRRVPGRYTGLDFNPAALEQAAKDGVRVLNETVEHHAGNATSPYSVVTAFQVIEHMAEPRKFLDACLSLLRPGGLLVLSVPSEDSFVAMLENAVVNMPPHHVSRWTDQTLGNLQDLFGMELVALGHEKLEPVHFDTFIDLLAQRAARSLLGWERAGLIDLSLRKRIIDKLSGSMKPMLGRMYANPALWPDGHSVTAVYRKTAGSPC